MDVSRLQAVFLFLLLNVSAGWMALRVTATWWGGLGRVERWAAAAVVFCGEVVAVEAILGFTGYLNARAVAAAVALPLCLLAFAKSAPEANENEKCLKDVVGRGPRTPPNNASAGRRRSASPPYNARRDTGIAPYSAAALFCLFLCVAVWAVVTPPPAGGDGFIYHLYFPAVWLRHAAIEYVPLPYGAQAATYYPMNTESLILWLMLPFHEDFLANAAQVPFLLLCGALVAGLAERVMGARRDAALAAGAAAALIPAVAQQAVVARVDVAFAAWFLAALLFVIEWGDSRRARDAALAGAAFGLFIGTKSIGLLYGILILAPFVWMLRRGTLRSSAASVLLFGAAAFAFGGFWYARNWLVTGNPVYPLNVGVGGATIFTGAYGREAMRAFHTTDPKELARIFRFFLGGGLGLLFPAAGAAGLAIAAARRELSPWRAYLLLLPFAIVALFWWGNPHNNVTNGRFLFPAFFLFGVGLAYVLSTARGRVRTIAYLTVAGAVAWSAMERNDLAQIVREVVTALAGTNTGLLAPARGAVALLAASGVVFGLGLLFRGRRVGVVLLFCGALLLMPALSETWKYHEAHKYEWYGAFQQGRAWAALNERVAAPARVANCGGERAYGLFGTGLRNEVFSVNIDAHPGWQFHDYHLRIPANRSAPGTERPQFHRSAPDVKAWVDNLNASRVDILFCAALDPISRRYMEHDPDGFPIEAGWAAQNTGYFRELYRNEEVRVYRFLGDRR